MQQSGVQLASAFLFRARTMRMLLTAACLSVGVAGVAQQSEPSSPPEAPTPQQETKPNPIAAPVTTGVGMFLKLQNKSLVFPDLATEQGRLTSFQKLQLAANNTVSLSSVGSAVIGSLYGQATNRPSGYGQGWEAYGQRFGADMARTASYNLFANYALASALHQDPRFYVKEGLNFQQSLIYSARRLIITRNDDGLEVVNYSGLAGTLASEGLATTYYPEGSKGAGSMMIRFSSDLAWRFAGHMLRQYWPEINRRLQTTPEALPNAASPRP